MRRVSLCSLRGVGFSFFDAERLVGESVSWSSVAYNSLHFRSVRVWEDLADVLVFIGWDLFSRC